MSRAMEICVADHRSELLKDGARPDGIMIIPPELIVNGKNRSCPHVGVIIGNEKGLDFFMLPPLNGN